MLSIKERTQCYKNSFRKANTQNQPRFMKNARQQNGNILVTEIFLVFLLIVTHMFIIFKCKKEILK